MSTVNSRVQKHRESLRKAGLRPVQLWVPDTRRRGFAAVCRRQCLLATRTDAEDAELQQLMNESVSDLEGWAE